MPLDLPVLDKVYALWDGLADFDAINIHASRTYLLEQLSTLVDAQNADWIGCVRLSWSQADDPMKGWRPRTLFTLAPCANTSQVIDEAFQEMEKGQPDITTLRNVELAGSYRVLLLNELANPDWFAGPSYQRYYKALDRQDSIWAGIPVSADAEVQIGLPAFAADVTVRASAPVEITGPGTITKTGFGTVFLRGDTTVSGAIGSTRALSTSAAAGP